MGETILWEERDTNPQGTSCSVCYFWSPAISNTRQIARRIIKAAVILSLAVFCVAGSKTPCFITSNTFFFILADEVNLLVNVSLNLTKNLQGIMEILPDESCRFEANVSLPSGAVNSSLEKYKFRWEVSTIYEDTGQFSPIVELLDKDRNITISSGYMPVGLTFVRVSVIPKETSGPVNYDFGFIRILPRLKITIYGPEIVIKGGGTVQLNSVMEGVLTELLGKKAESVTYLWSCAVDNSVSSNMTIKNSTQNTSSGMQINTTKCFQPDVLKSAREQNLVFNPDLLISNRTYIFHVMASQGRRIVTAAHKLRVDTNISLSIK